MALARLHMVLHRHCLWGSRWYLQSPFCGLPPWQYYDAEVAAGMAEGRYASKKRPAIAGATATAQSSLGEQAHETPQNSGLSHT